jgi:DNA-binding IclR family transcriptional regulator
VGAPILARENSRPDDMNGILARTLGILEFLSVTPEGAPMATIAEAVGIPRSATHRLLAELAQCGYVRQTRSHGDYVLTTKLVSLGLSYLSRTGIVDVAQPLLDRLAEASGELVRLSVVDGERLTWVARAQGARSGLRYDPDMGMDAKLSCTATGHAWLLTMTDEEALQRVALQGFGTPKEYGPNAPTTVRALLKFVHAARSRGFSMIDEVFAPGMSAVAAPVVQDAKPAIGVISIAGPRMRLTDDKMLQLGPMLIEAAGELAALSKASMHFKDAPLGRA